MQWCIRTFGGTLVVFWWCFPSASKPTASEQDMNQTAHGHSRSSRKQLGRGAGPPWLKDALAMHQRCDRVHELKTWIIL
jgi:hypothetical protein